MGFSVNDGPLVWLIHKHNINILVFHFLLKGEAYLLQYPSATEILFWNTEGNVFLQTVLVTLRPTVRLRQHISLIFNGKGNLGGK